MANQTIITCAVTGGAATVDKNPAVPVTPEQIATAAIDAGKAGAAIAHIHVRDPETSVGSLDFHLFREVVERIRDSGSDILINLTSGSGAFFVPDDDDPRTAAPGTTLTTPERRVRHIVELKPDICSLDMGSFNFGDQVFLNLPSHLKKMADAIRGAGVKPELEVFDVGQIRLSRKMMADGDFELPMMFQICLGIAWAMPATPEALIFMRDHLPDGVNWAAFGVGPTEFSMVAQAILLGGHVRVGLEDNLYLERGVLAPSNAALVEKASGIISILGGSVASSAEASEILGLGAD